MAAAVGIPRASGSSSQNLLNQLSDSIREQFRIVGAGSSTSQPAGVRTNKHGQSSPALPPRKTRDGESKPKKAAIAATTRPSVISFRRKPSVAESETTLKTGGATSEDLRTPLAYPTNSNKKKHSVSQTTFAAAAGGERKDSSLASARKKQSIAAETLVSERGSNLGLATPRGSGLGQELVRRASNLASFARTTRSDTKEDIETRKAEINNPSSARNLSTRLSYARANERTFNSNTTGRKKSENIFTKAEQRSIRLAATEAKIAWDAEANRLTSDDTSLSGGSVDETPSSTANLKKRFTFSLTPTNSNNNLAKPPSRKPSEISMQTVYKDNKEDSHKFEFSNPQHDSAQHSAHHGFGMLFFSGGGGSMVLEDDE